MNKDIGLIIVLICNFFCCYGQETTNKRVSKIKCEQYSKQADEFPINKTKSAEFPHIAVLGWQTEENKTIWHCTGALLSDNYIIVPAHCLLSLATGSPNVVRLGDEDISSDETVKYSNEYKISKITPSPNFTINSFTNDIALIQLETKVTFSNDIRPACLWQTYDVNLTTAIVTFWDFHAENKMDKILDHTDATVIEQTNCATLFNRFFDMIDGQICFDTPLRKIQPVYGPAQIIHNLTNSFVYDIIGIGSLEVQSSSISVLTRVSSYLNWIESIVWP